MHLGFVAFWVRILMPQKLVDFRRRQGNASPVCLYTTAVAQTLAGRHMRFMETKSETLNLRVSPSFKEVLKELANQEQRSMVNMLEVLLSEHCDREGIVMASKRTISSALSRERGSRDLHAGEAA